MTRIAHLADLHLGFSHLGPRTPQGQNQRQADFANAAMAVCEAVIAAKPDVVVIAGDLLHETNLYPAAMAGAVRVCERFNQAGLEVVVIGGNHDEAESTGRYNALRYLAEHHGLRLYLDQSELDIAGVRLHLASFRVISRSLRGRGELRPFNLAVDRPNVLVTHGYTPGVGVPEIPEDADTDIPRFWIENSDMDLKLLGHIHHHGEIAPGVFYAGSIERRNFGETNERPGFWIHDIQPDGQHTSRSMLVEDLGVPGVPRPMIQREIDCANLTSREVSEQVLQLVQGPDVPGAMMRVVLQNVSAELDRSRARSTWERAFRKAGGFAFDAVTHTRQISELLDVEFAAPPADISKGFLEYLDQQLSDAGGEGRDELLAIAEDVMEDAREKVLSQQETD